jgi:heterodisulfide reductase subunit B
MTRQYAYFPGCTLSTTAIDYDASGRAVAAALGVDLAELDDWNCCGATFPLNTENVMDMLAPARILIAAEERETDVAALCAVCFNVLKRSDHFLRTHPEATRRLNLFVEEGDYTGAVHVRHLLDILRDDVGWDAVRARTTTPLKGMRLAPYYGCLLLRPQAEMNLDDPEAPTILHDLIAALGAQPVSFPDQAECCGSYLLVSQPQATERLSGRVVDSARQAGAEMIVTACPLCQYNLSEAQKHLPEEYRLPVVYFTQVMAAAFGLPEHAGRVIVSEVGYDQEA